MIRYLTAVLALTTTISAWGAADSFKVTTDKTVDNSSLETIVADVIRLSGAKTNDEKAIAIYNYLNQTIFHNAYPNEKAPQSVGPLKVLNVYGWGLCGGQHTVLKSLFETAGWQVRYRGWSDPGHTTVEVNYDNHWHYFDVFLKAYFWTKDKKTIAGQDDIIADPSIVLDGDKDGRVPKESYLCCGDDAPGIVKGCKNSKATEVYKPEQGWASVTGRDQGYAPLLRMSSGGSLKLEWKSAANGMVADGTPGTHSCPNMKDVRNNPLMGPIEEHYGTRNYSDGTFTYAPDFNKTADVADVDLAGLKAVGGKLSGKGSAIFKLEMPYPYAAAKLDATAEGDCKYSLSVDGGKTWAPTAVGDISAAVRQHYAVWIKADVSASLSKLSVEGTVEHNRMALPYLLNGKNTVTVSDKDNKVPAGTVLVVTYTYQETTAPAKRNQYNGQGLTYSDTKTVTKEIDKLPFTFDVTVGGNSPPKMLALERALKAK